jgi:hypothetical protein
VNRCISRLNNSLDGISECTFKGRVFIYPPIFKEKIMALIWKEKGQYLVDSKLGIAIIAIAGLGLALFIHLRF